MSIKIYNNKEQAAANLADELVQIILSSQKPMVTLAISGGTTPYLLFEHWAKNYLYKIPWEKLHFFWVDERCVEPESPESNYGNTKKTLFDQVPIPPQNIHRMMGENEPELEAVRYAEEVGRFVVLSNELPQFDIVLLGMGDDGHTASIFSPSLELLNASQWVETTKNPYSYQQRITLTGNVINNARHLYFLVTGQSKAPVLKTIFEKLSGFEKYPAAHIYQVNGNLTWVLDTGAASLLS
jgi:6-phosphogluconolactonase